MSDLSEEERALLAQARQAPGPSAADRARIRRAIAAAAPLAGVGTFAAASKAAGATSAGVLKTVAIFVAAAGLGSTLVAGAVAVQRSAAAPVPKGVAPHAPPRVAAAPPRAETSPVAPSPQASPPESAPRASPRPQAQPPARPAAPAPPQPVAAAEAPHSREAAPACTMNAELATVQSAERLLDTSPARALQALDALERECSGGELSEERRATRALALCALGRRDEGRAQLAALRHANPSSPFIAHIANTCDEP